MLLTLTLGWMGGDADHSAAIPTCESAPKSAPPGATVTVTASGLTPNLTTHVDFGSETAATGITDAAGTTVTKLVLPEDVAIGDHRITIRVDDLDDAITAVCVVTVTAVPNGGEPGLLLWLLAILAVLLVIFLWLWKRRGAVTWAAGQKRAASSDGDMASPFVYQVFKTSGTPALTYVERDGGKLDKKLERSLNKPGTIVLLTGPSKCGKTTLYTRVHEQAGLEPLLVRCKRTMNAEACWRQALESLDADRVSETEIGEQRSRKLGTKIAGKFSWFLLAGLEGEGSLEAGESSSEKELRKKILAEPSPTHVLRAMQKLPVRLVIEDFHYLPDAVQAIMFQQGKTFVDNDATILAVSTSHRAMDLAKANPDLTGRVTHIPVGNWREDDLRKIVIRGLRLLRVTVPRKTLRMVGQEAVGMPILAQAIALELMLDANISEPREQRERIEFDEARISRACHAVCKDSYEVFFLDQLEALSSASKDKGASLYKKILSAFLVQKSVFSIELPELLSQTAQLPLSSELIPEESEVLRGLSAIAQTQARLGLRLLDWDDRRKRLYLTDPTFVFFLRWRKPRRSRPSFIELLEDLGGPAWSSNR